MEGIEPEDDLLERPAGDRAHDHRATVVEPDTTGGERVTGGPGGNSRREAGDGRHCRVHAPLAERAPQPDLVPAGPGAQDGNLHVVPPALPALPSLNDLVNTSGSRRPARKTRPEARLLTTTSAGLKSIRSIL